MKDSRIKWTAAVVVVFIVLFLWALSRDAHAEHAATLGLGAGVFHAAPLISQRIGYRYDDRWEIQYERYGGRDHDASDGVSVARHVMWNRDKKFAPYLQLGVAYFDELIEDAGDSPRRRPLVSEHLTYKLGLGVRLWQVMEVGLDHNSSAGRSDRNHGIDRIYLSYVLRF